MFEELHIARATSIRSIQRTAQRCRPAYEQIRQIVRDASEVTPDETGWRMGGRPAWLHAFVSPRATSYEIDPTRGHKPAKQLLGLDWAGTLVHDGWSVLRPVQEGVSSTMRGSLAASLPSPARNVRAGAVRCRAPCWRSSIGRLPCVARGVVIASAVTHWPSKDWSSVANWSSWSRAASRTNRIVAWPIIF